MNLYPSNYVLVDEDEEEEAMALLELQRTAEKNRLLSKANLLYERVVEAWQTGGLNGSNPCIVPYLTKEIFIEWIISQERNKQLRD